ncbi:hypothetical protein L1S35_13035 [Flavobacterium sp. AS60]|uniref:hypothetical protein n=1 Tax=Flavobacterium anseongense TaxID=2910677 RepID=UPI001F2ED91B|nr:hypothetical protein [Flavobacterium sp. AS60]MCF6130602.1 hypothetical protein [Flavobacterium sp. AS60]
MSTFEIEILSNIDVCVELNCTKCESIFSVELDLNPNDEMPYYNNGVLHCEDCDKPYEYSLKFDMNKLQVIFKEENIIGGLKESEKINLEEYKFQSTNKSREFYYIQINRLQKILEIHNDEFIIEQSLNRLVYSGIITSLETYLGEILSQIVFHSNDTFENFISEFELYKKEKLSLSEIIIKYRSINNRVKEDLENIIYHNINKLVPIFNIFKFELDKFEKLNTIAKHIKKRHNFVHRSGLDENENFEEITKEEIRLVIEDINLFVEYVHQKIENRCYLPDFDFDFPF